MQSHVIKPSRAPLHFQLRTSAGLKQKWPAQRWACWGNALGLFKCPTIWMDGKRLCDAGVNTRCAREAMEPHFHWGQLRRRRAAIAEWPSLPASLAAVVHCRGRLCLSAPAAATA